MIKEDDISLLNQNVKTLEDSFSRLKEAYDKKDSETFNKLKKTLIQAQKKILESIK